MDPSLLLAADAPTTGIWPLFVDSFDLFTVLLIVGSLSGVTVIFVCLLEIRESRILPTKITERLKDLVAAKRWSDLEDLVRTDGSYLCRTLRPVLPRLHGDRTALREAAELAASEESARWFRKIETLNVIGNLGPLVGLAGTVWGMILAFTSLGAAGGQAEPADLSLGISKALFHTLLGLCLAIPCLLVFGMYRSKVDRICTRGMMLAADLVDRLPVAGHDEGKAPIESSGGVRRAVTHS
jgi:biopolymer transport protein ExbB